MQNDYFLDFILQQYNKDRWPCKLPQNQRALNIVSQFKTQKQTQTPITKFNRIIKSQTNSAVANTVRSIRQQTFLIINILQQKSQSLVIDSLTNQVRQQKIKRQIKILSSLNHQSIIKLIDFTIDKQSKCHCLILEYVQAMNFQDLVDEINDKDVKNYLWQLLNALSYCHSNQIMHRDIKPHNVLFDHQRKIVKIADWGLAQHYKIDEEYTVRVASRHYKAPELLLNNKKYDYSLDIWSLGLVFASMLFRTYTLFRGNSNPGQLNQYLRHFGYKKIKQYIQKYNLQPDEQTMNYVNNSKTKDKRSWDYYIDEGNRDLCQPSALDLLDRMLEIDNVIIDIIDKKNRITAQKALKHDYFKDLIAIKVKEKSQAN